ncbi:MAG: hypothetical protein ABIQ93_05845 [Saprospiraceae bacterium]
MNAQPIPTPAQVLALLQSDGLPINREDFIQAFKTLYPQLDEKQRAELLRSILAYVDSLLSPQQTEAS